MNKLKALSLKQKVADLFAMQDCAIHALSNPGKAASARKVLVQVAAELSGLEEALDDIAHELK